MADRVPLTVIGGYLGAGKTTLINRLLSTTDGTRYAVLVNDLGAVDVDAALLSSTGTDRIVLSNGCLCCSLADGLTDVMLDLSERTDEFDHVVVELSGVGLPGPVARWGRAPGFVPGVTLVLAAADSVVDRLADPLVGDTVERQLGDADLVALTRTDLVDDAALLDDARAAIRRYTSTPPLEGPSTTLPWAAILSGIAESEDPGRRAGEAHHDGPGFVARTIQPRSARPSVDDLQRWLEARPAAVWRVKGVVDTDDGPQLVQAVGRRVEVGAAPVGLPVGSLVAIAPTAASDDLDAWVGAP